MEAIPSNFFPAEILIVDDKLDNLNLLTTMLTEQHYQVRRAISGEIALRAIQNLQPDLILLDITMPGMSGYDVCQHLKANPDTADIPVIFISALNDVFDKLKAFTSGGLDYITKPFEVSEVLARVANQLNLRAARAEVLQLNQVLELRVAERTQALQTANASLQAEVQQRQAAQEKLHHQAFHDALTELPNRSYLLLELEQSLQQAKAQEGYQFAVLFLDCDRFKVVNDSLGHIMGDQLLMAIVQRLQNLLPPDSCLVRPGGDEFMVLLRQIDRPHYLDNLAEKILQDLSQPFYLEGHELYITVSMGIAIGDRQYETPADLLRDVDTALYQAKDQGRAHFQIFHPKMYERALQRLQLEHQMRRALHHQEFALVYQPLMTIQPETVAGFEALIRWQHPQQGWISPEKFIPIAEETGIIIPLGLWVLEQACRQARQWEILAESLAQETTCNRAQEQARKTAYAMTQNPWRMSVNLSVKQFACPYLIPAIDDILARTQLSGHRLKLEITETALMENADSARVLLAELKSRHIQLAIDDFGTGYSSLGYLHRFPVDTLKIDRCFMSPPSLAQSAITIDSTITGNHDLRIVKAAVNLAHEFGMDAVAEGIETPEMLVQLKQMGCDYAQGYYFSKPLPGEEMTQWLGLGQDAEAWEAAGAIRSGGDG